MKRYFLAILILASFSAPSFAEDRLAFALVGTLGSAPAVGGSDYIEATDPANAVYRFVDPDSAVCTNNTTCGTTAALTSVDNTHAYPSLSAWNTARVRDLTSDNTTEIVILGSAHANHTADTSRNIDLNGWTTEATNYIHIRTSLSGRHTGKWDTAKYRIDADTHQEDIFLIRTGYAKLTGIQMKGTSTTFGYSLIRVTSARRVVDIDKCILWGVITATKDGSGIRFTDFYAGSLMSVTNSIIYGFDSLGQNVDQGNGIVFEGYGAGEKLSVYNVTIDNTARTGIRNKYGNASHLVVKNTYAQSAGVAYSGTIALTTSASSDATGTAGLQNIAPTTSVFTNVTKGSEDYHLPAGSPLIDVGTNTSGESAPLNFTKDIDGVVRTGTWDIGADER